MLSTVGLIGDPVAHSVSPAMHNAAFAAHDLDEEYVLWPTPAESLRERVGMLRSPTLRGANVTLPHKTAVMPLLDALDDSAQAIGAVNTVVRQPDGSLYGINTDAPGFAQALRAAGYEPRGGSLVVLGAGGAARAVVYALLQHGVRSLVIANRTLEHATSLIQEFQALGERTLQAVALDSMLLDQHLARADLLINATSVGLDGRSLPLAPQRLHAQLFVVDLIYHMTPLLKAARACGARTQDGLEMLVQQGAIAFEAWTGLEAPVDVMRVAARQALEKQR
jgi:shikimate dehydrogenase